MPELPEVETLRVGLKKYLLGHKILEVGVRNRRVFQGKESDITGVKNEDVRRFAKVVSIDLSNGNSIIVHIKLTGQLIYRGPNLKEEVKLSKKVVGGIPGPHTHVIFKLDKGGFLYYNDVRRFGWIRTLKTEDVQKTGFVGKLGPEPFKGLNLNKFKETISKNKRVIKVVLMDQEKIGGVGNIYANDALWLAKINPKRSANTLSESEVKLLYESLIKVLKEGIKWGGASELAFVTAEGREGGYQNQFLAYGQQGELCSRCKKEKIQKYFLGGRGTYYCPYCQK